MPTTLVFKFLAAVIFNFVISVHTLEVDLTVDVKPGHEECFYEEIKKPTSFEIEYQVGKGQILALDLLMTICIFESPYSPQNVRWMSGY